MKISILTQRPIQTLVLIYLLNGENINIKNVYFSNIINKKIRNQKFHREDLAGEQALKFQCQLLKINFFKVNNPNSKRIINIEKKQKSNLLISFVTDIKIKKYILDLFRNGVYGHHGGLLPKYKGLNSNLRALKNNEKFGGITFFQLNAKLDNGKIIKKYKAPFKNFKSVNDLEQYMFYKYKIKMVVDFIKKIKK